MTLKNKKKRNAIKATKNKSSLRKLASITTNTLSNVYSFIIMYVPPLGYVCVDAVDV